MALMAAPALGQDWSANPPGNVLGGAEYLGAAAGSTVPLRFTTIPNLRHEWRTQNTLRMRLLETNTTQTIGSYLNQTVSGNLGVGLFTNPNVTLPWSTLHLDDNGSQVSGYRPWQRPGMTVTHGSDLGWVGLKDEGGDRNHLTLAWADNNAQDGPDRLKFIFLMNPGTGGTAGTLDGLEAARIRPAGSGNESFFGIGDWFTTGGNGDPRERLDVLDGRVRIRQLLDDPETQDEFRVVVVDNSSDPNERGVLKWRDIGGLGQCDWIVQPGGDVSTAYVGLNTPCPTEVNNVGIGVEDPFAKLDVQKEVTEGGPADIGVRSVMRLNEGTKHAFEGHTTGEGDVNVGVLINSDNAARNWGVVSYTGRSASSGGNVVSGFFQADGENLGGDVIGVWSRAVNVGTWGVEWAGYFEGRGLITGGPWTTSDESLKHNIEDLSQAEALERVLQLQPKQYEFNIAEHPNMGLLPGVQHGFLAQDVEQLYPHLVAEVNRPAVPAMDGGEAEGPMTFKAMNYEGLIPELTAALQQEHQLVQQLAAQVQSLQQQVSACCAADVQGTRAMGTAVGLPLLETDLRIVPNPVADRTELRYTVGSAGRVRLEVTNQMGRLVFSQDEGLREPAPYTFGWDTTLLAAGTYFCTLYVNDEPLVKKAVKLAAR